MISSPAQYVYLVGVSPFERDGLDACLRRLRISPEHFDAVGSCREALGTRPCHLLVVSLDVRKAGCLQLLSDPEPGVACIPKLALVDHGDIPTAVQAVKAGAVNCLERPVERERLLAEITTLLRNSDQNCQAMKPHLSPMETTVLHLLLEGKTNQETARALHRSPRTIEVHRNHIMRKLGASNMVGLVKIAASRGLLDGQYGGHALPPIC